MKMTRRVRYLVLLAGSAVAGSCGADRVAPPMFPDLVVLTDVLPPAVRGQPYTEAVHAEGGDGDYDWDVTDGTLPPGLSITVDDLGEGHAILTGVPDADGTFNFTLTVVSGDGQSVSASFSLEVLPEIPLSVQTPALPPALDDHGYDVGLAAYGGDGTTFAWELVGGGLPSGLELTPGGRIQGVPAGVDTTRFTVEVRSGLQAVQQTYDLAVVPHRPDQFDITIFPVNGEVPTGLIAHLEAAIAEWEAAITGDLAVIGIPPSFFRPDHCGGFGELINGTHADDVLIIINISPIDGPGGVLGRAGACGIRSANSLPFAGVITLDSDDLLELVGNPTATYIIAHEIAHVLGFGTLWPEMELIEGAGTTDPRFIGPAAVQEFNALGGEGSVPVENQGGEGTRDAHWRQNIFGDELMTGFSAPPGAFQPLSRVSIASFDDLGYEVDLSQADSFTLGAAVVAGAGHGHHQWAGLGYDEILLEPIRVLDPAGRHRTIRPR